MTLLVMGPGHYTAFGKSRVDGSWNQFDDAHVKPVSAAKVQSPAAYVLFYHRMTTEPVAPAKVKKHRTTSLFHYTLHANVAQMMW